MARETGHCVRLFDEPDAREALRGFAERRGVVARRRYFVDVSGVAVGRAGAKKLVSSCVDALGLVVVDPVRGPRQALDAVEALDIVAVGFGELGAEVAVALPPDDQRWAEIGRSVA